MRIKKYFDVSYVPLCITACVTILVVYLVYTQTQQILKERLQERLLSIVSTAALQINADDVKKMQKENKKDSKELAKTIGVMKKIRDVNKDLKYIYVWSEFEDPTQVAFTADAEMLVPIDRDGNGKIEAEEIPPDPGEPYDISELPRVREAFIHPAVQNDFIVDKWGIFLSGFAPIQDSKGKTVAILGIDVEVSDYYKLIRATFVPFLLLSIFLLLVLSVQTIVLVRIWRNRVDIVKELDRQKDAVLHMVAHQFKGPVTTINFTTELLLDGSYGELTPEQKENVTTIRTASQKMGAQSEMVLDAAKITLGKLPLNPVSVDLNELFKEVVKEAQNHAKQLKVHMKAILPDQPLPTATLDRKYTQLAIDNLLSNAVKYTALKSEGGNVEFVVSMKGKTLFCSVKDTGIGIPKAEQENIFKELYRASNAGKDGNGLGLRVARGAIEAQGGKMWFESEEGKGTTFFVELPLHD